MEEDHHCQTNGWFGQLTSSYYGGELKNQDQTNLGLINLTSDSSESLNLVEIITCVFAAILVFYLLSWWCQKRKAKKMQAIRHTLASVRIEPDMARCPVLEAP